MEIAAVILSLLLATAYGAAFHFFVGGPARHIPIYIVAAILGFALGQMVGQLVGFAWLKLGVVYLLAASVGSWLALVLARFVVQKEPKPDA
jgi:hypothetical protein